LSPLSVEMETTPASKNAVVISFFTNIGRVGSAKISYFGVQVSLRRQIILTQIFHTFPQSLEANAGIVSLD
jgi:hypothetical protein